MNKPYLWPSDRHAASVYGLCRSNDAASYVNTLIGMQRGVTGYDGTMPLVTTPFGMTSWTAQTRQNKISVPSYNYDDTTISGFIGTHQPAIWMGDYGYVTLMPQIGALRTTPNPASFLTHSTEKARPDYYSGALDSGAGQIILAETTATERCAMLRFTFPKTALARVLVEASRPGVAGFASVTPRRARLQGITPIVRTHISGQLRFRTESGDGLASFRPSF